MGTNVVYVEGETVFSEIDVKEGFYINSEDRIPYVKVEDRETGEFFALNLEEMYIRLVDSQTPVERIRDIEIVISK